jgi:hypothetical protein
MNLGNEFQVHGGCSEGLKVLFGSMFAKCARTITFQLSMNVPLSGGAILIINGLPSAISATAQLYFASGERGYAIAGCLGSISSVGVPIATIQGGSLSVTIQQQCSLPAFVNITFAIQVGSKTGKGKYWSTVESVSNLEKRNVTFSGTFTLITASAKKIDLARLRVTILI